MLIVEAQISIVRCIAGRVTLRVLEDEGGLSRVHVRSVLAAAGQRLVERRLVSAVRRRDDRCFELHVRVGMRFEILLRHVRNFVREAPEVDRDFLPVLPPRRPYWRSPEHCRHLHWYSPRYCWRPHCLRWRHRLRSKRSSSLRMR